jgi:hypothetical protein
MRAHIFNRPDHRLFRTLTSLLNPFIPMVIAATIFPACPIMAQEPGDSLWTRVYGGEFNESTFSIRQTCDGGFVTAGYSYTFGPGGYDVYLLKTDANGDTLWTRTYGGSEDDYGYSVEQTTDRGYIIAGSTESYGTSYDDAYLIKTDFNGDTLWTRTYDGTGGSEAVNSVQQTTDGGFILAGYTYFVGTQNRDVYLWKTDSNGDTLWTRSYGGDGFDIAWSIDQTADGGYIVAGHTTSFAPGEEIWLLRIDANGDTLWTGRYDHRDDLIARHVMETRDGGFIVAGNTDPWGPGADAYLMKTDADGNPSWSKTYDWNRDTDYGNSVRETSDGGYILAGYTWGGSDRWFDVYVVKTNDRGRLDWEMAYGGSVDDHGQDIIQTNDGGYLVAGSTRSSGAGAGDIYLLKIAGEILPLPPVSVSITPDNPPVIIPQGGSFTYTGSLTNNTTDSQTVDAWIMVDVPDIGLRGPVRNISGISLSASEILMFPNIPQDVPEYAPIGFYNFIAYCGTFPSTVLDSSYFQVEVIP